MAVFTLLVVGLLCLVFKSTRLVGIAGMTLLFLLNPFVFLVLLVLGCVFLYLNFKLNKRKNLNVYTQSKLPN